MNEQASALHSEAPDGAALDLIELYKTYILGECHDRLTDQQETDLLHVIAQSRAATAELSQLANSEQPPDRAQLVNLRKAVTRGELSYGVLIASHMRMIHKLASDTAYSVRCSQHTEDLTQIGITELYRCIEQFDPNRGAKLATIAYSCIRQRMMTWAVANSRQVSYSRNDAALVRKFRRAVDEEGASPADAAAPTRLPVASLLSMEKSIRRGPEIPLNTPLSSDGNLTVGDQLVDRDTPVEDQATENVMVDAVLRGLRAVLANNSSQPNQPQRDFDIMLDLLGHEDTRRAVADRYSLSGENIRLIKNRGLQLLTRQTPNRLLQLIRELGYGNQ